MNLPSLRKLRVFAKMELCLSNRICQETHVLLDKNYLPLLLPVVDPFFELFERVLILLFHGGYVFRCPGSERFVESLLVDAVMDWWAEEIACLKASGDIL